jgi:hypothetical protein
MAGGDGDNDAAENRRAAARRIGDNTQLMRVAGNNDGTNDMHLKLLSPTFA